LLLKAYIPLMVPEVQAKTSLWEFSVDEMTSAVLELSHSCSLSEGVAEAAYSSIEPESCSGAEAVEFSLVREGSSESASCLSPSTSLLGCCSQLLEMPPVPAVGVECSDRGSNRPGRPGRFFGLSMGFFGVVVCPGACGL
jgi:hypothetical protein